MKNISLLRLWKEYPYESVLLMIAGLICIISGSALILTANAAQRDALPLHQTLLNTRSFEPDKRLTVDVSGSVLYPNTYRISSGTRLKDILEMSGGFTPEADSNFVNRNFNMSRFLSDQEKIYVPSKQEISAGIFIEQPRELMYLVPTAATARETEAASKDSVHINSASLQELDTLEGIGTTLGNTIIKNRPYTSIDDLVKKKVLKQAQFTKIKGSISL